ncbi:MAG TPA: hypothetical protein VGC06_13020 [Actinomycetes bacterium]
MQSTRRIVGGLGWTREHGPFNETRAATRPTSWLAYRYGDAFSNLHAMSEPDDPRTAFVYQEALRGLTQQQTTVDGLHISAGTLIFAASFASSLLGSRALSDGLQAWDWAAVVLLFAIGALAVVMLWPYYNFWSRFDVEELLSQYVDAEAPATMTEMHRALAVRLKRYQQRNQRIIRRIREAFQLSLILLLFEIVAWLLSIAGMHAS